MGKNSSSNVDKQNIIEAEVETDKMPELTSEDMSQAETADRKEFLGYVHEYKGNYKDGLFRFCYQHNIPFSSEAVNLLLKHGDDSVFSKLPEIYIETVEADFRFNDKTFFDQLKRENFEKIYSEDLNLSMLSEDDKRNRQQVISIIGYDPFENNLAADKPQLYRDLTGMLTDSMRKDIPRSKAAVEVVTGYNNIAKYQKHVNELMSSGRVDEDTQKQLDKYLDMINKMRASVLAIGEKNGFSNSRALGSNGRGMLSDVMTTVDEHMYDPGISNYYDIATSQSIKAISDISNKSMLAQIKLTGQEYSDMLAQQSKIVHESQKKVREATEALRMAKAMITKERLISQLESEYRAKGIDEKDIAEFIEREYDMWEGK